MTAPMIRADAPELLALVALVRDCIETNSEFQTQWDKDAASALAAWETIAPKPATDALAELKG